MTTRQRKDLCGAVTRRGHACRNPSPPGGGFCWRHHEKTSSTQPSSARRAAGGATGAETDGGAVPPVHPASPSADSLAHLEMLQDAALRRALAVHLAEEHAVSEEKKDAAVARGVRLAAAIARLRLVLSKSKDEEAGAAPQAELVVYRLPDNGR